MLLTPLLDVSSSASRVCACARERLPASPPGQLLPVGKERAGLREAGYEPELALAWELSRRTRIPAREFRGREEGADSLIRDLVPEPD